MQRTLGGLSLMVLAAAITGSTAQQAAAQVIVVEGDVIVRPPVRPFPRPIPARYRIHSVDVNATVRDQIASVHIAQVFQNT